MPFNEYGCLTICKLCIRNIPHHNLAEMVKAYDQLIKQINSPIDMLTDDLHFTPPSDHPKEPFNPIQNLKGKRRK